MKSRKKRIKGSKLENVSGGEFILEMGSAGSTKGINIGGKMSVISESEAFELDKTSKKKEDITEKTTISILGISGG